MTPVLGSSSAPGAAGRSGGASSWPTARSTTMADSDLRDPVEGGFFRYSTRRDWTDPHYERMLYDNAQLLRAYSELAAALPERADGIRPIVEGLADFLIHRMQIDGGGFGSGQDSESTVDGVRVEGGYYRLDAEGRAAQTPPALDGKVLTGWNGLAIDALALAGFHVRPGGLGRRRPRRGRLPALPAPTLRRQPRPRLDRRHRLGGDRDARGLRPVRLRTAPAGDGDRRGSLRGGGPRPRRRVPDGRRRLRRTRGSRPRARAARAGAGRRPVGLRPIPPGSARWPRPRAGCTS